MRPPNPAGADAPRFVTALGLLWLAGASMRIPLLAVPPMIPSMHDDLRMTETQVGAVLGLPLLLFAIAAVPGSLLVARLGALTTAIAGLLVLSLAAAGRGAAFDIWTLYIATIVMGLGISIMQPAVPRLVREWMPDRVVLGTATYTNGMIVGTTLAAGLTIAYVLPAVGGWRFGLVFWALPGLATALLLFLFAPRGSHSEAASADSAQLWWPDWKSPLTWQLGLTFGCNNSIYFSTNAFLPDFLNHHGRPDLIGPALGWLNGTQILASLLLLVISQHVHRRAWPFLVFGPINLAGIAAVVFADGIWIVVAAAALGFSIAMSFVVLLAMPPLLSRPDDVHRTAAGMFTVSYSLAVIVPIICGALWDLTHLPWTAFLPIALAALAMMILGTVLSRYKHD